MNRKTVKQYLKLVSKRLSVPKALKTAFIHDFREPVASFAAEHEDVTVEDLFHEFGTPDELAHGFASRKDYDALLEKAKKVTFRWRLISVIAAMLIVALILLLVWIVHETSGVIVVSNYYG